MSQAPYGAAMGAIGGGWIGSLAAIAKRMASSDPAPATILELASDPLISGSALIGSIVGAPIGAWAYEKPIKNRAEIVNDDSTDLGEDEQIKIATLAHKFIKQAGLANIAKQTLIDVPLGLAGGSALGLKATPAAVKGLVTGGVPGLGQNFMKSIENTINSKKPINQYISGVAGAPRFESPARQAAAVIGMANAPVTATVLGGAYLGDKAFGHSYRNRINKMETDAGIARTTAKQQQSVIAALQAKLNAIRDANATANQLNKAEPVARLPDPYAKKPKTK